MAQTNKHNQKKTVKGSWGKYEPIEPQFVVIWLNTIYSGLCTMKSDQQRQ